jgi:hypothetical protein
MSRVSQLDWLLIGLLHAFVDGNADALTTVHIYRNFQQASGHFLLERTPIQHPSLFITIVVRRQIQGNLDKGNVAFM